MSRGASPARGGLPHRARPGRADALARLAELARRQRHAALATASRGQPYLSLVAFALAPGGRGVLFATARRTRKFRNLAASPRVALLVDSRTNTARDYRGAESVTVEGVARMLRRGRRREEFAAVLCARHPALRGFVADPGTALVLVEASQAVHVGRFQEVSVWRAEAGLSPRTRRRA